MTRGFHVVYSWLASTRIIFGLIISIVLAYAVVMAGVYATPAFAADEIACFVWAGEFGKNGQSDSWFSFLWRANASGYGGGYWTVYFNLQELLGLQAMWVMRFLAWVALVSVPVAFLWGGKVEVPNYRVLACLCWISMPMAWWSGKVTGPDLFAVAFVVWGNVLVFSSSLAAIERWGHERPSTNSWLPSIQRGCTALTRLRVGWFVLGVALGLKLTMLPCVAFSVGLFISLEWRERNFGNAVYLSKKLGAAAGLGLIGFVVGCPNAVTDFSRFTKELIALPGGKPWDYQVSLSMLSNETWAWDGVFSGGLEQWSFGWPCLLVLALLLIVADFRVWFSLAFAFLTCWAMISYSASTLGWYWFGCASLIPCSIFVLSQVRVKNSRSIQLGILACICLNLLTQAPRVQQHIKELHNQSLALKALPAVVKAIDASVPSGVFELALDFSEVSHVGRPELDGLNIPEVLHMSPRSLLPNTGSGYQANSSGNASVQETRTVKSDAFVGLVNLGNEGTHGINMLLIVSRRLAAHHHFRDMDEYLATMVIPKSPLGTRVQHFVSSPTVDVYGLRTPE